MWLYVCGIIICIIFSNIFSSAEMSYSSCNRLRLENAKEAGSKRAGVAVKIIDRFDDSLSAILIGNNLANIANSSLGSLLVLEICSGDESYAWVSTLVITVLVIIFGETIPKIVAKSSANRFAHLRVFCAWPHDHSQAPYLAYCGSCKPAYHGSQGRKRGCG